MKSITNLSKIPHYLHYSLAFLWLYSGVMPMVFAQEQSLAMLTQIGIGSGWDWLLFVGASVLDVLYAVLIIVGVRVSRSRQSRSHWLSSYFGKWFGWLWLVQFLTVLFYSLLIGVLLPENWLHPFAPLIKNVPIMALMFWLWREHASQGNEL